MIMEHWPSPRTDGFRKVRKTKIELRQMLTDAVRNTTTIPDEDENQLPIPRKASSP